MAFQPHDTSLCDGVETKQLEDRECFVADSAVMVIVREETSQELAPASSNDGFSGAIKGSGTGLDVSDYVTATDGDGNTPEPSQNKQEEGIPIHLAKTGSLDTVQDRGS